MEKKDVVNKLLERGLLVSPKTIENMNEYNVNTVKSSGLVVGSVSRSKATVLGESGKMSVDDVTRFYKEKYEGVQKLLMKKMKPISISNISKQCSDVGIIVMVGEHTAQGFVGEDTTGSVEIVCGTRPPLKDVLGVIGDFREGRLVLKEILYPDVPLPTSQRKKKVLTLGGGKIKWSEGVTEVSGVPTRVSVDKVDVLVCEGSGDPQEWLVKRHLPGEVLPENNLIITKVPDILWVLSDTNNSKLYKGVIIVHTDKQSSAVVDVGKGVVEFTARNHQTKT